ncbi:retropepsin-like aspartic protease [Chryseobacterium sp. 2987]|uniref:retropepsin-like aspartic protease n=1 Tax=Chryseobacterium sp. 2987 TaxID=2817767 RepID=UPI00285FFEE1|nr:retropepsin-like aspartic protease [Chryseobacterium sp. 2987]MDR6922845.1 hypothetical protein [Chryseobacterium sp. 2987]
MKKYLFIITFLLPFFLKAATIPFEMIEGKMVIKVTIENELHNFVFDTGAFTIISSELRDKIASKKTKIIFEGIDGNNVKSKMDVFSIKNIQVSNLNIKEANFSFADIGWISSRACMKISGIFGANLMKDKIWQLDFKNKKIVTFDKADNSIYSNTTAFPFITESFTEVPKVNLTIRNQNIEYVFDSGSGMGLTLNQQTYNLVKDDNFLIFEGFLAQSINSVSKGERQVDLMEVEMNNTSFGNQIIDSSTSARNLIGTRFMQNYLITLDFINKKMTLIPNGNKPEYKTFGIALAPMKDDLIIVNKLQISQLAELNLSDKIIKVNGIDISKITPEIFCEVKKTLDTSQTITIENAEHKKITLEKKNVLQYLN